MKKNWLLIVFALIYLTFLGVLFFVPSRTGQKSLLSPLGQNFFNKPRPLEKYSFENLRKRDYQGSEIKLEKVLQEENSYFERQRETRFLSEAKGSYTSWLFSFQSDGKKVTGMLNMPATRSPKGEVWPVVVMLRGYADDEIYFTGLGTRKGAGVFAENGFITLAPDFLGFGGSDTPSADILEARFERPITVLNLLTSIKSLPQADPNKIFLWAHSNGGQIALSVLEISQKPIPTVLWAPVTKGFPESVLQYIGEMDDQGLKVKKAIDDFLNLYDSKHYSIDQYWDDIQAPLQVHQGLADEYIQTEWTDNFAQTLKDLGKNVTYYKYPKNDHNLSRDWDLVVARDLKFFQSE